MQPLTKTLHAWYLGDQSWSLKSELLLRWELRVLLWQGHVPGHFRQQLFWNPWPWPWEACLLPASMTTSKRTQSSADNRFTRFFLNNFARFLAPSSEWVQSCWSKRGKGLYAPGISESCPKSAAEEPEMGQMSPKLELWSSASASVFWVPWPTSLDQYLWYQEIGANLLSLSSGWSLWRMYLGHKGAPIHGPQEL